MKVDGIPNVRTCITPTKTDMVVETNDMKPSKIDYPPYKLEKINCDVAIIGGGPAGMSAAIEASHYANILLVDENHCLGGQLTKQTHKFFGSKHQRAGTRGIEIARKLEKKVKETCSVLLNTNVIGYYNRGFNFLVAINKMECIVYYVKAKKVIIATGAQEKMLIFEGNDLPGVYGAGGVQTLMNVYGVKPGDNGLVIGTGNVGLILAYQLLQAGISVEYLVEAMTRIGGYFVHAAKIRRNNIKILTEYTIAMAYGNEHVEGAKLVKLDDNWNHIKGSEIDVACDFICLAIGLTPAVQLITQTGADTMFIGEAGGWVSLHNEYMETTKEGVYVAGDLANIEEASTAMIEGKIAGLHASCSIKSAIDFKEKITRYIDELNMFRQGYFGERPKKAQQKILEGYYEKMGKRRSN
jgi:sarcosine oxidase subunit alpha